MPRVKTITITAGFANEMRLWRPEFEMEVAEDENFQLKFRK
jgi:hypothetical protein